MSNEEISDKEKLILISEHLQSLAETDIDPKYAYQNYNSLQERLERLSDAIYNIAQSMPEKAAQ